jgi:hypothetical protein
MGISRRFCDFDSLTQPLCQKYWGYVCVSMCIPPYATDTTSPEDGPSDISPWSALEEGCTSYTFKRPAAGSIINIQKQTQ